MPLPNRPPEGGRYESNPPSKGEGGAPAESESEERFLAPLRMTGRGMPGPVSLGGEGEDFEAADFGFGLQPILEGVAM